MFPGERGRIAGIRCTGGELSMEQVCPYCKKPFLPGQTLTSDICEDVVHLDCELKDKLVDKEED